MATATAKPLSLGVSYSINVKANLGDFESADVRLSRDEAWDVTGLTKAQVNKHYRERYEALRSELAQDSEREYNELIGKVPA